MSFVVVFLTAARGVGGSSFPHVPGEDFQEGKALQRLQTNHHPRRIHLPRSVTCPEAPTSGLTPAALLVMMTEFKQSYALLTFFVDEPTFSIFLFLNLTFIYTGNPIETQYHLKETYFRHNNNVKAIKTKQ